MSHKVSQGLRMSHKVNAGSEKVTQGQPGLKRSHKVSQGLRMSHKVSQV